MQLHRILLVAKRDYLATVATKGFLIGLVVFPLLCGSGLLFLPLLRTHPDVADRRVLVVDRTAAIAPTFMAAVEEKNKDAFDRKSSKQTGPRYVIETVAPDDRDPAAQRLAICDRIRNRELYGFLEIGPQVLTPDRQSPDRQSPDRQSKDASKVAYYSNDTAQASRRWYDAPLTSAVEQVRLARAGVAPDRFHEIQSGVTVERMALAARDEKTGAVQKARKSNELETMAAPLVLVMLLSMVVMIGASPIMAAVIEDRSQRIVEMLLGLTTPYELMFGKVVAAVGISLTSSALYVFGGTLALIGMGFAGMIPFSLLGWFFVYLVADVLMLCALGAAVGSPCNTVQEAQSLSIFLFLPMIGPFMIMGAIVQQPNGIVATVASFIPPFTPRLMLLRQAMPGGVPAWQPWVALLGVIPWTLLTVWGAARVFRVGILMQGKTPKLPDLVRWAIRG